jgi:hypothetical protein
MNRRLFNAQMAQYTTPTITGESGVAIENGIKCYLPELKVAGNTTQQTYTGKNLFDYIYYFENRNVTSVSYTEGTEFSLKPNTTYFLTTNIPYTTNYANVLASTDKTGVTTSNSGFGLGKPRTITANSEGIIYIYTRLPNTGYGFAVTREDFENGIYWIQIAEGTVEESYEPYVGGIPAPNPDYPQEIINAGDNGVEVEVRGVNLYDARKVAEKKSNGLTCSAINNIFTVNGTATIQQITGFNVFPKIRFKPNTTYSIRLKVISGDLGGNQIRIYVFKQINDQGAVSYVDTLVSTWKSEGTFVNTKQFTEAQFGNYDWLLVSPYINAYEGKPINNIVFRVDIVEGSYTVDTFPEYEPYVEPQKITIPSSVEVDGEVVDLKFAKVGDYADTLIVDGVNKKVTYQQKTYAETLSSSKNWVLNAYALEHYNQNYYQCVNAMNRQMIPNVGFSNLFPINMWATQNDNVFFVTAAVLLFRTDGIETLDEWKAKLDAFETPLEILCAIKNPIEHDITNSDIGEQLLGLIQNNGTTIIEASNTNNLSQTLTTKYLKHV